jgi:hypothetical protein
MRQRWSCSLSGTATPNYSRRPERLQVPAPTKAGRDASGVAPRSNHQALLRAIAVFASTALIAASVPAATLASAISTAWRAALFTLS